MATRWRDHEDQSIKSSLYKGYKVKAQKSSKSTGKRPDIFGISKTDSKDRIIGDAKWTLLAKKTHINQNLNYRKHPFYASKGVLHYPANALVPKEIKQLAKAKNIKIVKTRTKKEREREPGFFSFFSEKKYLR